MPAKLIFFKSIEGEKSFAFCPLVKIGCKDCFVPPICEGENDPHVAFRLVKVKDEYKVRVIE